jgi:putative protein-disulfide isomerase
MTVDSLPLVYFVDPTCSWCWGFAPVIDAIREKFGDGLPIQLVMGGLRPGTREPMEAAARDRTRSHWEHVHTASGQPFDFSFFDRQSFVYDTEPAARAVVVTRRGDPDRGLAYLRRVQAAFYSENLDVTDAQVLANLVVGLGLDREAFLEAFPTDEVKRETQQDFAIARRAGITGFPTLIAGTDGHGNYALVTQGFQSAKRIVPAIDRWLTLQRGG